MFLHTDAEQANQFKIIQAKTIGLLFAYLNRASHFVLEWQIFSQVEKGEMFMARRGLEDFSFCFNVY